MTDRFPEALEKAIKEVEGCQCDECTGAYSTLRTAIRAYGEQRYQAGREEEATVPRLPPKSSPKNGGTHDRP